MRAFVIKYAWNSNILITVSSIVTAARVTRFIKACKLDEHQHHHIAYQITYMGLQPRTPSPVTVLGIDYGTVRQDDRDGSFDPTRFLHVGSRNKG